MKTPVQRDAWTVRQYSIVITTAIALLGLLWWVARSESSPTEGRQHAPALIQGSGASTLTASMSDANEQTDTPHQRLTAQWLEAKHRLDSYRVATQYPPESQPIAAHADKLKPFNPVVESRPAISAQGTPIAGRHLVTTQDRVYVSGQDSVLLTVSMLDDQSHTAPLRIIRATAHEVQDSAHTQTVTSVALPFDDRGANGDVIARDGIYSARLQPAAQGFSNTQGTLRVDLDLQSDTGGPAHAFFDIIYTPHVPATWRGGVREATNQGSLDFYLKAEMRDAGRYIVTARAYDATGKPFALLSFNDEVSAGPNEIRLTLFGKLIRDAKPAFPITLRDVDGYLLYESQFPDRAMMPRWAQTVYTSQPHAITEFADTEWSSEQRQRYLNEYARDVQKIEQSLQGLSSSNQP